MKTLRPFNNQATDYLSQLISHGSSQYSNQSSIRIPEKLLSSHFLLLHILFSLLNNSFSSSWYMWLHPGIIPLTEWLTPTYPSRFTVDVTSLNPSWIMPMAPQDAGNYLPIPTARYPQSYHSKQSIHVSQQGPQVVQAIWEQDWIFNFPSDSYCASCLMNFLSGWMKSLGEVILTMEQ